MANLTGCRCDFTISFGKNFNKFVGEQKEEIYCGKSCKIVTSCFDFLRFDTSFLFLLDSAPQTHCVLPSFQEEKIGVCVFAYVVVLNDFDSIRTSWIRTNISTKILLLKNRTSHQEQKCAQMKRLPRDPTYRGLTGT